MNRITYVYFCRTNLFFKSTMSMPMLAFLGLVSVLIVIISLISDVNAAARLVNLIWGDYLILFG